MKGGMDDQRLGVAASAATTELQDLRPIGEELKEIVLTRKPGDSYESRLENKTQFFDRARELLQSVTTTMTINYEDHFNDEFRQLLSKHPNITFSDLPEIEKINLAEKA